MTFCRSRGTTTRFSVCVRVSGDDRVSHHHQGVLQSATPNLYHTVLQLCFWSISEIIKYAAHFHFNDDFQSFIQRYNSTLNCFWTKYGLLSRCAMLSTTDAFFKNNQDANQLARISYLFTKPHISSLDASAKQGRFETQANSSPISLPQLSIYEAIKSKPHLSSCLTTFKTIDDALRCF